MILYLQQPDKKKNQNKIVSLFLCPLDVSGLIWKKNQIFISLKIIQNSQLNFHNFHNSLVKLLYITIFVTVSNGNLVEASKYH